MHFIILIMFIIKLYCIYLYTKLVYYICVLYLLIKMLYYIDFDFSYNIFSGKAELFINNYIHI